MGIIGIALVCGSAKHIGKLSKLLIDNTVEQLPELAAIARKRKCEFVDLSSAKGLAEARCLNDPAIPPAPDEDTGLMHGIQISFDVDGYMKAGERRGITIGNGLVMARCTSLEDVYILRKAAEAGIPFAAAGLFAIKKNNGWDIAGVRAVESAGGELHPRELLYERYAYARGAEWSDAERYAITSHVGDAVCDDLASVAGALLTTRYLGSEAGLGGYEKCGVSDWHGLALNAEAIDWADPASTPERVERACLDALGSLPLPVTVVLRMPLESKTLLEGQPVSVSMAWPGDGDSPVATVSLEGDGKLLGWIQFDLVVFGATTLPGARLMYALLPHLTAWICKVRPAWSNDAGTGCRLSKKINWKGEREITRSGDIDYLVQITFTCAHADLRAAVADAMSALSSRTGERSSAPWGRAGVPRIAMGSEDGVEPWPNLFTKARTKRKNLLKKASARGCSVAALSKLYRAGGYPMRFSASDAGACVPAPLSLVDLNIKVRQAVLELTLVNFGKAGSPEPTKEAVLKSLNLRSLEFNGIFLEEPKTDELADREGIEVVGAIECGRRTARVVKVRAIVRATPQHVLYALAGHGVIDYEMMAGYKPLPQP